MKTEYLKFLKEESPMDEQIQVTTEPDPDPCANCDIKEERYKLYAENQVLRQKIKQVYGILAPLLFRNDA